MAAVILSGGCERTSPADHPIPSPSEVAGYYEYDGDLSVEISGNVAQVTVAIDLARYRAGGTTWLRASPFIFLFSPATRDAMDAHPGLGGVRVIVRTPTGDLVGQALLERGTLNTASWRRALSVAGLARRDGTETPGRMRDLIRWGEDHTEFEYNPRYVPLP